MVNLLDSLTKNDILSELHAKAVAKYAKDKSIPEILALQELGKNLKISQLQFIIEKIYNDKETTMYEGNVSDIKYTAEYSDIIDYRAEYLIIDEKDNKLTIYIADIEKKGEVARRLFKAGKMDLTWKFITYSDYKEWMDKFGKLLLRDIMRKKTFLQSEAIESTVEVEQEEEEDDDLKLQEGVISGKMYNCIKTAVQMGASDIHFEPGKPATIRVRVDGLVQVLETLKNSTLERMNRSLKSSSSMKTDNKFEPSGGSRQFKIDDRVVDCRISACPTVDGDKVVVRFLNTLRSVNNLKTLGMSLEQQKEIRKMTKRSSGLILITGPTGAGKTASLISLVHEMNSEKISIDTIEDPVEQRIQGVTQRQIDESKGLHFNVMLKEVLRQDPDVIVVGETRDVETAKTVMVAGNTGHLVLSTLHTNTACTAITRLIDMGVEPFLVSSNIIGVVNQRLLRRVCPYCKKEHIVTEEDVEECNLSKEWIGKTTYEASEGCSICEYTGYDGRVGIYEVLTVDSDMKELIKNNMSVIEFENLAKSKGFRTLRDRVVDYLTLGIVSLEELERTLYDNTTELPYNNKVIDTYAENRD